MCNKQYRETSIYLSCCILGLFVRLMRAEYFKYDFYKIFLRKCSRFFEVIKFFIFSAMTKKIKTSLITIKKILEMTLH